MEQKIIQKIGDNKTTEKTFNDGFFVEKTIQLLGFYTYKGEVCILDSTGMDVNFSEYSEKDQKVIYNAIMNNHWTC